MCVHVAIILYIGILNVWHHISGEIALGDCDVAGEGWLWCSWWRETCWSLPLSTTDRLICRHTWISLFMFTCCSLCLQLLQTCSFCLFLISGLGSLMKTGKMFNWMQFALWTLAYCDFVTQLEGKHKAENHYIWFLSKSVSIYLTMQSVQYLQLMYHGQINTDLHRFGQKH